jgi:hypothetical protein
MLIKTLAVGISLILCQAALADDGGYIGIKANDIKVTTSHWDQDGMKMVTEPVAEPNYSAKIIGGEASKLLKILPADETVLTAIYRNFPKWVEQYNKNFRGLVIAAGDDQPKVTISCAGADLGEFSDDKHPPKITPSKDGAHCWVTVDTIHEGDIDFNFDPAKQICGR